MNVKSTKIVATISDQRCDTDFLQAVIDAGVNVVRLNSAHMNRDGFTRVISNVRSVSNRVPILMDTKGPEVRTTETADGKPLDLKTGMRLSVIAEPTHKSTLEVMSVNYTGFVHDIPVGAHLLFDDGLVDFLVEAKTETELKCIVQNDGEIGSRKSVNVPGVTIKLPALTERDKDTIHYCIENDVAFIAHSFVRSSQDVLDIQKILDEHQSPIKIISKIENQEGVNNIDEIIDASYGIMIARGDLGIELPPEKIPAIQNMIIRKCTLNKKPVIVATQMLHTMITSPRPTRAEVSDVANAILSQTDAVMLSGETAYGKYPIEAVKVMSKIISEAEKSMVNSHSKEGKDITDVTAYLAKQTVRSVETLGVKAIITDSYSGRTARFLAAYRAKAPVFAICYNSRAARELNLSYGIRTIYQPKASSKREYYIRALKSLLASGAITENDMVAYIGGSLADSVGTTNLEIHIVKDAIDFFEEQQKA